MNNMRLPEWSIYHESLSILLMKITWIIDLATSDAQPSVVCVRRPGVSGQCQGRWGAAAKPVTLLHHYPEAAFTRPRYLLTQKSLVCCSSFFTTKSLTNSGMFHGFFEAKC